MKTYIAIFIYNYILILVFKLMKKVKQIGNLSKIPFHYII